MCKIKKNDRERVTRNEAGNAEKNRYIRVPRLLLTNFFQLNILKRVLAKLFMQMSVVSNKLKKCYIRSNLVVKTQDEKK